MKSQNNKTFQELLKAFNEEASKDVKTKEFDVLLTDFATACTYSVLKKIYNVSADNVIKSIHQELTVDIDRLKRTEYAAERATKRVCNDRGDEVIKINDKSCYNALLKLTALDLGDGLDLRNDAVIKVLEEVAKQKERDPEKPVDMERPYTVRRLKQKVYIKTAESVNGWETVKTTPIQEVYKAIRRSIMNNKSVKIASNKYSYVEDIATDAESENTECIYQRLPKYADLGSVDYIPDYIIDGAPRDARLKSTYTADYETVKKTESIIDSLKLTARQNVILKYRMCGYGYKAIARAVGVSQGSIYSQIAEIRRKAEKIGYKPEKPEKPEKIGYKPGKPEKIGYKPGKPEKINFIDYILGLY